MNVELLEKSFQAIAGQLDKLVDRFYKELFKRHPQVKTLFSHSKPAEQRRKLAAALKLVVNNLRKPETLTPVIQELGRKHQGYGALPEHYAAVATTLLDVMKETAGPLWTDEVHNAWSEALNTIASLMLGAYARKEGGKMSSKRVNTKSAAENTELTRLRSAVENTLTAIMMVDRDLVVTYANKATMELLKKQEATLRTVFPGFSADKLIGMNIDGFHKNPAHQRQILGDVRNLPHSADIKVGPLTFNINVTAQLDKDGTHIGSTLEWYDVTEQRARDRDVARLQAAVDGAQTSLMLCDTDLNITYVNPSVTQMLNLRQAELRKVFPGFDANRLVGSNIDQFHKNPAHQRALLSDTKRLPAKAEIKVADLEFEVNATAILDRQGKLMGNMVEWKDITEQKDAERQIQGLIEAAAVGDLDKRIESSRYAGFTKRLADGINQMMDAIVEPLRENGRVIKSLAEGDLNERMQGEFKGEFAALRDAVNTCVDNLLQMVTQIRGTASSINTSASEIAQGNTDLSQRTEEQASSLEETASSMEELTGTVKQNAENARQANQLAAGAREQAERGGQVVGSAISAMAEINKASKKIADIISVIDEIAFQTNLLALNAAVEAARAGEQGRGFAVVASEVRNLAQRSAGAAKEIKTLINDSVDKVEEGGRLVNESGATLETIVTSVKKVSEIIAEIAAASEEQSAGIEQVNKAVAQMDQVVQQNAALVEEAAAASESMDEQSKGMMKLMEFFKVEGEVDAVVKDTLGQNRRSPSRPWVKGEPATKPGGALSAPRAKTGSGMPTKAKAAAAGGGADTEWEDF